jgi:hypothetical protein
MRGMAADLSDANADRIIYLVAAGLVLLGIALAVATVWWWRSTRPEHPSLGPLEVMGEKRFRRSGDAERRQIIANSRPPGAQPLIAEPVAPQPVDLAVLAGAVPQGFDDLRVDAPAPLLPAEVPQAEVPAVEVPAVEVPAVEVSAVDVPAADPGQYGGDHG